MGRMDVGGEFCDLIARAHEVGRWEGGGGLDGWGIAGVVAGAVGPSGTL